MRTARKIRRVTAVAAATAALTSALVSANATAAHASVCTYIVGDPEVYYWQGVKAGTIEQYYDPCGWWRGNPGDVAAVWVWDQNFQNHYDYRHFNVSLGFGSMGLEDGAVRWADLDYVADTTGSVLFNTVPHSDANPASWRVGAMLDYYGDGRGCVAWTSQHYYANGAETAGPYAGCGDDVNIKTIPWTQP